LIFASCHCQNAIAHPIAIPAMPVQSITSRPPPPAAGSRRCSSRRISSVLLVALRGSYTASHRIACRR
jgi:hypothetical protein